MTPEVLQPLHNVIIWASHCADPIVWQEAARRYVVVDQEIGLRDANERQALEESVFRMLPSDWPLWMESCRFPNAGLNRLPGAVLQN
ncbi:MAG: hypothetical protein IPJ33_11360 [Gammaproteobacteria bacterium]|jgi:hypothetical protein|nr:hypothetical protein [Gammaproteobacteria bacterium]MBP6050938.1 hypothetical protein [Pseudomonadales bacterium]MBK6582445.1 hypothetical protein [Gammaproteobacteria bacterium]MBK7169590.1 hypothetical protein [Gammaproteobacteria bacterium]MBK7521287.1 hypothetical protein [Gammaproteobacteria bacterium]